MYYSYSPMKVSIMSTIKNVHNRIHHRKLKRIHFILTQINKNNNILFVFHQNYQMTKTKTKNNNTLK